MNPSLASRWKPTSPGCKRLSTAHLSPGPPTLRPPPNPKPDSGQIEHDRRTYDGIRGDGRRTTGLRVFRWTARVTPTSRQCLLLPAEVFLAEADRKFWVHRRGTYRVMRATGRHHPPPG